jgi:hypothetical protein
VVKFLAFALFVKIILQLFCRIMVTILGKDCEGGIPVNLLPFCSRNEQFVSESGSPWSGSALPNTIGTFNGVLDIFNLDKLYVSFWLKSELVTNRPKSNWGIDLNGLNARYNLSQQISLASGRDYTVSFMMIRNSRFECAPGIAKNAPGFLLITALYQCKKSLCLGILQHAFYCIV